MFVFFFRMIAQKNEGQKKATQLVRGSCSVGFWGRFQPSVKNGCGGLAGSLIHLLDVDREISQCQASVVHTRHGGE